jgi:hypothetical protein
VTGIGTPNGTNLIESILKTTDDPLDVDSPLGFIAIGPVGGSFSPSSQTYTLTNLGTTTLGWSIINTAAWLSVSASSGTLAPGDQAAITVALNSTAQSLLLGTYKANLQFVNANTGVVQSHQFTADIGNAGFEIGDFTYWTFNAQSDVVFPVTVDYSRFLSTPLITGVDDWEFVSSGLCGAFLGQNGSLGYLSQTLPTKASQYYILSFWYSNPATGTPNEFLVSWNGSTIYDGVNLAAFDGKTAQYIVKATGASTLLKFGFRNDQNAFGLDDISVIAVPSPTLFSPTMADGGMTFSWTTTPGVTYQPQYTSNLLTGTWNNLGSATKATSTTMSYSDESQTTQRFYRVLIK